MSIHQRGSTYEPLTSLVASARRLTRSTLSSRAGSRHESWQDDAWEMFDLVGEHRFLSSTLAQRMSQARLYIGKRSPNATDAPTPVDDPAINSLLTSLGATSSARAQLIARLGVNLFVAGDGWLCGIPRYLLPDSLITTPPSRSPSTSFPAPSNSPLADPHTAPTTQPLAEPASASVNDTTWPPPEPNTPPNDTNAHTTGADDLEWRMLSVAEVSAPAGGDVIQIRLGDSPEELLTVDPDEVFLIRVWRPHPRRWWEADSPTRSSLPVLRELVGLTMHVSSQIDSRLAGAGVLLIPQSAQRSLQVAAGLTEQDAQDVFTEALMSAMLTPIVDRANASALVPLCVTVPDETTAQFRHLSFDRSLDASALSLRDEAIRRLALGLDAPPELLLGSGQMSHWSAWLVLEDVITTHIEPPLALICDALTTQYLHPVLISQGVPPDEARSLCVWYDVSHLVVRPNKSSDAQSLFDKGVISSSALRKATGFDEADAPPPPPPTPDELAATATAQLATATDPLTALALQLALDAAKASPSLLVDPTLPVLVAQIRQTLAAPPTTTSPTTAAPPTTPPPTTTEPASPQPSTSGEARPPSTTSIPSPTPQHNPATSPPSPSKTSSTTTHLAANPRRTTLP